MQLFFYIMFFKKHCACLRLLRPVHVFPKKHISSKVLLSQKCEDVTQGWECAVGLEVHAQINAKSKLFSRSAAVFGAVTNSSVSYFDAAYPGTLPVLNKFCVEAGILTALALNCTINKISAFDRKHYFYPDLPAGYQITQHFHPLACNGHIKFIVHDRLKGIEPYECCTHLQQLQLEQDSGKSFHLKGEKSYVDLNRAGIGLMELVFSPTLKNGLEAASLVKELILILSRLGTCTCELEEGTFRVDANISVNRVGEPLGVKTEVKNINSVRFISRAIDYEINRQIGVLEDGGFVANETRAYDYDEKKTVYMRDKGTFQDYRFMPEPNLPPIKICDDSEFVCTTEDESSVININELKKKLPVLPDAERCNLRKKYNLPLDAIDKLVSNEGAQEMFEICASDYSESDLMTICDFLFSNVQHQFNLRNLSFKDCPVSGSQIAEILELLISRTISEGTANDILDMLFNGDQRPAREIVNEYNWFLIRDPEELKSLCLLVMATHKKVAQKYRKSKKKRHMAVLIAALNESVNNRASYKEVAAMFHNLICKEEKEMDVHKIQEDNKE